MAKKKKRIAVTLFAENLALEMERQGITITALARHADTYQSNVSQVLANQKNVTLEYAERLAHAVGKELRELL